MKKKFYVTTTIPYANAPPHIGFALEIVQADVLARWHSILGEDVFFLTGTDEHGVKNYKTAKENGLTPQQFVDKNSGFFRDLTKALNISNDSFIRTTDKKVHWPGVVDLWKILEKNKDIYKKKYAGNYCSGCERFVTERDLVDGKCSNHPNLTPEFIDEENYFFKLSKYSDKIKDLIKKDKLKIIPEKWKNDFLSLIKDGLTDVSFSRDKKHLPWGIPVPGDENQVMYVWPDALSNYLTGIGYPYKKYKKYWPADVHVVGKDMLRFHTGIWPGMLLSAGIELPKQVVVHGFLTVDGQKMSKSLGNVISPIELRKSYDSDSIRYYLMRNVPFGDDGDFSEKSLIERHNSELANKLGNLVSRVSALAEKFGIETSKTKVFDGIQKSKISDECENKLLKKLKLKEIEKHFDNFELDKVLNLIFEFIDCCNLYVQDKQPWVSGDKKVIYELADSIKAIGILLYPFIPSTSEKIAKNFGFKIDYSEIKKPLKVSKIKKAEILFVKIEDNSFKKESKSINANEKVNKSEIEGIANMDMITKEYWEKLDLRVAQIRKVEDIEGADKLYKLTVDVGELGERVICAGIKPYYQKDKLKNKKIIIISNLEPRVLRGIESKGMLLAAGSKEKSKCVLLTPDSDVENGSKIS